MPSAVNHIWRNTGFDSAPRGPRWFLRAVLCFFASSQWMITVNSRRHYGHLLSKLTCQQSWQNIEDRTWLSAGSVVRLWCGSQSTVCVITGETVFCSSLNNNTQTTGAHKTTHALICRVWMKRFSPPSGCSQSCRRAGATTFGLDWLWLCCQPSWLVEASSWRRKLCCD